MSNNLFLLERARSFDEEALAQIFDTYSPGIYRYAARLLGDPDIAEDCVAETFSRLLQALHKNKGPDDHLQAYLYRIAHNWITDYYRRNRPETIPLDTELHTEPEVELTQALIEENERQQIRAALQTLPPDQRLAVSLKYLEDWDNVRIAELMHKSIGAIKSLQHRALQALRRKLQREEE